MPEYCSKFRCSRDLVVNLCRLLKGLASRVVLQQYGSLVCDYFQIEDMVAFPGDS